LINNDNDTIMRIILHPKIVLHTIIMLFAII